MFNSILAISLGASIGAVLRWFMGLWLNSDAPTWQPGTLLANLVGGYLIGVVITVLAQHPQLSPEWKLFLVTGLLGGLTTFSTFSLETTVLLQHQRYGLAAATISAHVIGSVLLTLLGMGTVLVFRRS